jgi:2-polyprenyl-3-methyl-5-hydroxy-6-metoxy-1,4-benzoquinol methylase
MALMLISEFMREQNRLLHEAPGGYGGSGYKSADAVIDWAVRTNSRTILDYGCGEGTLKTTLAKRKSKLDVREYDPAIDGKSDLPDEADLVVCTDVLEHVEPEYIGEVLEHVYSLALRACYIVIATRLSNKQLPCGRNTHLLLLAPGVWLELLQRWAPFRLSAQENYDKFGMSHSLTIRGWK